MKLTCLLNGSTRSDAFSSSSISREGFRWHAKLNEYFAFYFYATLTFVCSLRLVISTCHFRMENIGRLNPYSIGEHSITWKKPVFEKGGYRSSRITWFNGFAWWRFGASCLFYYLIFLGPLINHVGLVIERKLAMRNYMIFFRTFTISSFTLLHSVCLRGQSMACFLLW